MLAQAISGCSMRSGFFLVTSLSLCLNLIVGELCSRGTGRINAGFISRPAALALPILGDRPTRVRIEFNTLARGEPSATRNCPHLLSGFQHLSSNVSVTRTLYQKHQSSKSLQSQITRHVVNLSNTPQINLSVMIGGPRTRSGRAGPV